MEKNSKAKIGPMKTELKVLIKNLTVVKRKWKL